MAIGHVDCRVQSDLFLFHLYRLYKYIVTTASMVNQKCLAGMFSLDILY